MRRRAVAAVAVAVLTCGCGRHDLDFRRRGTFSGEKSFQFGTSVVLTVRGENVSYDWKGYNMVHGGALMPPYEQLELSRGGWLGFGGWKTVVASRGNLELMIDDRLVETKALTDSIELVAGGAITVVPHAEGVRAPLIQDLTP